MEGIFRRIYRNDFIKESKLEEDGSKQKMRRNLRIEFCEKNWNDNYRRNYSMKSMENSGKEFKEEAGKELIEEFVNGMR